MAVHKIIGSLCIPALFCIALIVPAAVFAGETTSSCCEEKDSEIDCPRISAMLKYSKDLGLSDEQAKKLRLIRTALRSDNAWNIAELNVKRPVLREMMTMPAPDPAVLKETMKKVSDDELQMNLLKLEAFSKAWAVLNDAQKIRFVRVWTGLHKASSKQK